MNETAVDTRSLDARIKSETTVLFDVRKEMERIVVGQSALLDRLLIGLLSNGHVLLEGVPGLAKTTAVKALASALHCSFRRIQFTPDLLPADLVGTQIYNPRSGEFTVKKGPLFANIVLADEINRAPAKVQSALLEAMQERQVTIGDQTFELDRPFLVLATQNPIEQEGTYPLPEAQVDRFMMKVRVNYPTKVEERAILERMAFTEVKCEVRPIATAADILRARALVDSVYVDDKVKDYVVDIVFATREPAKYGLALAEFIEYGASPRATLSLTIASRAHAFLQGRGYVTPQDVKAIAPDVLRHRVIVSYEAEAEEKTSDDIVREVLDRIAVP
jgi:MoxR-like ATPase